MIVCDVAPRDGLQNEPDVLAPSVRADLVNKLADVGLKRIRINPPEGLLDVNR